MASKSIKAGSTIFEKGKDFVKTLDVVIKGTVRALNDYCAIDMPVGSIIGIGETVGQPYMFNYEAVDDVTVFSYAYESEAGLVALFKANAKLLGTLVSACVRFTNNIQKSTLEVMEIARTEYGRIKAMQDSYPELVASVGLEEREFPQLNMIQPPTMLDTTRGWHKDFINDLYLYETKFKKEFFSIPSIGLGIGLTVNSYALETREFLLSIFEYLEDLRLATQSFTAYYTMVKSVSNRDIQKTESKGDIEDNSVKECMSSIMKFGDIPENLFLRFSSNIETFKKSGDRYGSDDSIRKLRKDITTDFYEIYERCFFNSIDVGWADIPLGVKMFFMFGYVDMSLAGEGNAKSLAEIAEGYEMQKDSKVCTMYDWLLKIYDGEVMPSKNEFDRDYKEHLLDKKRSGDITATQEAELIKNGREKVRFEIKNLFSTGNRVTFGRITTFVPVFDGELVSRNIEHAYMSKNVVMRDIDKFRNIDYSVFCRQSVYSNQDMGINSFYYNEEVLPYVILMPNVGSRATLWQEIDGKKRNTPGRMIISILHTEETEDTFIKLLGEFRWEMCKTEQGVHWNDVTIPSLTAEYCDYLQFYRKNNTLSQDIKKKISTSLKNNMNNFKKVFINDYYLYIKYESEGSLRLNRVSRDILFTFCPFSKDIRDKISDNPQFDSNIKKLNLSREQKLRPLGGLIKKLENKRYKVPDVIRNELEFYKK